MAYRGPHPYRIKSVSSRGDGFVHVITNSGTRYMWSARSIHREMPQLGDDARTWNMLSRETERDRYQGWVNRETWCVALYLNNNHGLQLGAIEVALQHNTDYEAGAAILSWLTEEVLDNSDTPGIVADMLRLAYSRVDEAELGYCFRTMHSAETVSA